MRRYLGDFESARKAATTDEALIAAMKQQYPGLKQEKLLVYANAAFLHSPGQMRYLGVHSIRADSESRQAETLLHRRVIASAYCVSLAELLAWPAPIFERRVILTQRISKLAL
jgi:hypothetical protein